VYIQKHYIETLTRGDGHLLFSKSYIDALEIIFIVLCKILVAVFRGTEYVINGLLNYNTKLKGDGRQYNKAHRHLSRRQQQTRLSTELLKAHL